MIEVEHLTKRYGTHYVVQGISFQANPGEILGILGPNGAGKTTTMRMITGFMPPTSGTVRIDGHDVLNDSLEVRKRVGYMPERVPIYPDMTVEGYVEFWAKLRSERRRGTKDRVRAVLETVSLYDRRKSLVRNLSKGMRQRLGLAQALVHNPQVVILDEPTIGIDPQQVIEVRESVRALSANHTVLFSTHILSEAEQVCDRVIILNNGKIVAQGRPDELRQQLQPQGQIFVVLGGGKNGTQPVQAAEALKMLQSIPGVADAKPFANGYTVSTKNGVDVRPHISERAVQSGYRVLELRPVAMTLEDIFLDIVGKQA